MSPREQLAARSWAHLQLARDLVRSHLPVDLTDPSWLTDVPEVAETVRGAAVDLPARLVDGNLGAALAGHIVAQQHDHAGLDAAPLLQVVLDAAGGHVAAVTEVCLITSDERSAVYYRRRNCCLRDRVTDRHRCDTCSLRPRDELDEIVRQAIARR